MSPVDQGPVFDAAEDILLDVLSEFRGMALTPATIAQIGETYDNFRKAARLRNIDLPEGVVLALPKHGYFAVIRADADEARIHMALRVALKNCPQATAMDLATACMEAFPKYRRKEIPLPEKLQ